MTNEYQAALDYIEREHGYVAFLIPFLPFDTIRRALQAGAEGRIVEWNDDMSAAPRDGTKFYALIDGLPYTAKYDEYGRFIWYMHANVGDGAAYKIHRSEGKELLEQIKQATYDYQQRPFIWRLGFDHKPTHWAHLPPAPKKEGD